jgi:hypothetical protein
MDHHIKHPIDLLAEHVQALPRRRVVQGLGGLALGALGLAGIRQETEAARTKRCKNRCKDHCKLRHKSRNSNRQCRNRCQNKCH